MKSNIKKSHNEIQILTEKIIISAKFQLKQNRYNFPKHVHYNMEIYEILDGHCSMDINNQTIVCGPGEIVMVLSNVVHSFFLHTDESCTYRQIHFDPTSLSEIAFHMNNESHSTIKSALYLYPLNYYHVHANSEMSQLIDDIVKSDASTEPFSQSLSNLKLLELLINLIQQNNSKTLSVPSFKSSEQNHYVWYTTEYIHENYNKKILIPEIAAQLNISSRYLSKLFFHYMNLTILSYINIYRVNRSIDLLLNTDMLLTNIAIQVGFCSSQHYSKIFSKIIGLSPNRYKKLYNE